MPSSPGVAATSDTSASPAAVSTMASTTTASLLTAGSGPILSPDRIGPKDRIVGWIAGGADRSLGFCRGADQRDDDPGRPRVQRVPDRRRLVRLHPDQTHRP